MASFSSGNDNFTVSNSKQGNQSSFNATQQAAIKEFEDKITAIANSLQDTINAFNDFKAETAADFETKQDRLIPGSHVSINEANIISSNQINDSSVSGTETYSSDKIKSITDAIENNVNTKANKSYVDTNFENIRAHIDTKQDKLTAGSGITISDTTISSINYIDDNEPAANKSYSSLKTVQLDKDVYNNLYEYINSANYDSTILRINSDDNRFGSIIHAYSGITPGTYGNKDYADATQLACFTINSEGHAVDVRLDEIYPPVTAGKTYDYWMSNGSKRGNWQTPDSRPIDGSRNLITSGAVFTAVKHKGVFEAGLNIDISDYIISCTAIDNENISDTKTFSSSKIQNDMQQLDESINNIEALIPSQATAENILADRDFVNSSINSVTAFYITSDTEGSPFATKAALDNAAVYYYAGTERVPTANDYCVVLEDETHENKTVRYVYQSTEAGAGTWAFQYVVNDTPFTSDQLAALNSGITAAKVSKYDAMSSVEHITSHHISAQHNLYRSIVLSVNDAADIEIENGDGNCTLTIYNDNNADNVLKSVYGDEITVLGAHEFVVLMYSSGWKVVARQNNKTDKKVFITEAADPVNLTEQDDTHYIVQITNVDNIPIGGVILAQLPATAKDGAIYTITNISDRRLEVYTLVEPAHSPFSTREDSVVIEMGGTMQFVHVARTPGWFVTTEAMLSYYAYNANHADSADSANSATNADHATTATTANSAKNMYRQVFDLSALDKTKFYPVFCYSEDSFAEVAIHSPSFVGHLEYNQNRIHFDISTKGWNDTPFTLNVREYACFDNNEIVIGCIGRGYTSGGWAIWLRGGLSYYCFTRNCNLSLKTSDYTYDNEIYTVGTNYYGGTNTNVKVVFTPQSTITNGAYSNRAITAPTIQAETGFIGNLTGNATSATSTSYWEVKNSNFAEDLNDLEIGRWYSVNTSAESTLNAPNNNGWFSVLTFAANNNPAYKQQLGIYAYNNSTYTRTCLNGSWGNWERLATTNITGSPSSLNTTDKSNLVSAINEVNSRLGDFKIVRTHVSQTPGTSAEYTDYVEIRVSDVPGTPFYGDFVVFLSNNVQSSAASFINNLAGRYTIRLDANVRLAGSSVIYSIVRAKS